MKIKIFSVWKITILLYFVIWKLLSLMELRRKGEGSQVGCTHQVTFTIDINNEYVGRDYGLHYLIQRGRGINTSILKICQVKAVFRDIWFRTREEFNTGMTCPYHGDAVSHLMMIHWSVKWTSLCYKWNKLCLSLSAYLHDCSLIISLNSGAE